MYSLAYTAKNVSGIHKLRYKLTAK